MTDQAKKRVFGVRKFINEKMEAPNVLNVPIDVEIAKELATLATSRRTPRGYFTKAPQWHSDVRWVSAKSKQDFKRFQSVFDRLDIARHVAPYLDLDRNVRLYNSFLVIRSECFEPNFHVDWSDNNNEGFTLMTPLTANGDGFGLLYKKIDGSIGEYEYQPGEALIFGDDFVHSTKPGKSNDPVVLLCFNFGTDKMEYWPGIERTAGRQALLTCQPDGRFYRVPYLRRFRAAVGSFLRKAGLRRTKGATSGY